VPPADSEQLASALVRLLDAPEEAVTMGRAGRARVERYFSIDRWVRETIDLYDRALKAKGSRRTAPSGSKRLKAGLTR
jgi:glycosyltransferase involved in cell wall biosynthesis